MRVSKYAKIIAERLNLTEENVKGIFWAEILYDIGKLGIPQEILWKPTPLLPEEIEIIKKYSKKGYKLIKSFKDMEKTAYIILYPHKLKGKEIPYESRILAVVDSYDVMTTVRPYKKALNNIEAIEEIKKHMHSI